MADDLDLRAIRAFVAVVEAGDFTAAGRTLRLTRSAVGKALARLEAGLGVRLLHRTTRRVSTTSDGAVFYDRSVRLLADLAEAEDAVRGRRQDPRGTLRLTLPDAYGRWRIVPVLQAYMRRWPEVGVEVRFSDRFDDIVEEGLDLAVRTGGASAGEGFVTRVVDRIRGVLCASPDYLRKRGTPDGAGKLDGHDLLLFGERGRIRPWPQPIPPAGARPSRDRARTILDSAEAQRLFALAGLGIAHLPDFLVASDLDEGRLIALPHPAVEVIDVHVLYPERRLLPARVRLFIDMLVEALA
ncbi:MAG: LysR family transcriptional regulator [Jatrophihabitans endophyticus]|nr:LysR family transcriptional regulator [Jatrophihabitans endophyticus]